MTTAFVPGWRIVAPEELLEQECADKAMHQRDVALTYALAIQGAAKGEEYDWGRMNRAIIARWPKGLQRVKALAWKLSGVKL